MKRKLLTILLSLTAALCLCFGIVACDDGSTPDTGTNGSNTEQGGPQTPDENGEPDKDDQYADVDEDIDPDVGDEDPDDDEDNKEPDVNDDKDPDVGDEKDPDVDDDEPGEHVHTFTVENVCSECGEKWEYSEWLQYELDPETDTYTVTAVANPASGDVVIPYGYQGKWVTKIGDAAFAYRTAEGYCPAQQIRTITIPDSVTSIGEGAFSNCAGLRSINIPSGVTSIGDVAFAGCIWLEKIFITDLSAWCNIDFGSYYANPLLFAHHLYLNGSEVTSLAVPKDITEIKFCTFAGSAVTHVSIPDSVTSIGAGAFYFCDELRDVDMPSSVTSIGMYAFGGCNQLTDFPIPEGMKEIGEGAFIGCNGPSSITFPSSVSVIGEYAFMSCQGLRDVVIPDHVTSIEDGAFDFCGGMTSIKIGNGVKILNNLFEACYQLREVEIGDNVESISLASNSGCFCACISLEKITVSDNNATYSSRDGILYNKDETELIYVPQGKKGAVIVPDGVSEIGDYMFKDCIDVTSIRIPDSVISIGDAAFSNCKSLESLKIPDGVTEIGNNAFSGCDGLKEIEIGNKVESLTSNDFPCISLERITVSNQNPSYSSRDGILYNKDETLLIVVPRAKKGTVILPDSVTSIGSGAFSGCDSLERIEAGENNSTYASQDGILYNKTKTEFAYIPKAIKGPVTIPEGMTSIGERAFDGCRELTSITIPGSVASIGDATFRDCSSLINVTIHEGVTSIEYFAFHRCSSLTNIEIPNSVTSIGSYAFDHCTGLTDIVIPDSVILIERNAFLDTAYYDDEGHWNSQGVLYIGNHLIQARDTISGAFTVRAGTKTIAELAFNECRLLESITIPESVTLIGQGAFYQCSGLASITLPFVGETKDGSENTHFGYIFGASNSSQNNSYVPHSLDEVIVTGGTSIGESAFEDCSSLTSVTIPDSVTEIGSYTFSGCSGLTGVYITNLSAWCKIDFGSYTANPLCYARHIYLDNVELKELTIPNEITEIKPYVFYGCSGLTSVTIPDSVTSIGDYAFHDCRELTSVSIGSGVTSIGPTAFDGCSRLVEVWNYSNLSIVAGSQSCGLVAYCAKQVYTTNEPSKQTLTDDGYVFYEDENSSYLLDYRGNETNLTLPAKSPKGRNYQIYQYAFCLCSELTSVTIGSGVTSIGVWAFLDCSSLTSITIPDSVTSIGSYAFDGTAYYNDTKNWDDAGVLYIGNHVIRAKDAINGSYAIRTNTKTVADDAFSDCSSLENIEIPNSVTSIGNSAFERCSGLTSVTIGSSVTSIEDWAFAGCSKLRDIQFKGTVKEWQAIEKGSGWKWNIYTSNYTITCTDGTIDENGNVTYFEQ